MAEEDKRESLIDDDDNEVKMIDIAELNDEESHLSDDSTSSTIVFDNDLVDLQKVNPYIRLFPNFNTVIKTEAREFYCEIKENIVKSIKYNEIRPGLLHWTNRFEGFISEYGLYFTKEDHINIINIYLDVLLTPSLDLPLVEHFSNILIELLKKWDQLSRKEFVIDWRLLYNLYTRINDIHDRSAILAPANIERGLFNTFIKHARLYFSVESTQEMLDEWRALLCPFDTSFSKGIEKFELFLPTVVFPHEHDKSFKLWANEFLNLWVSINTPHSWENSLISLFARFASNSIGYFDWNPYIPFIFSHVLRGFGLPIISGNSKGGNVNVTSIANIFSYSSGDVTSVCSWIVSMIDEKNCCMDYLKQLFQIIRSFFYPSNTGRWSSNLYAFLRQLPEMLVKRKFREKKERHKWYGNTPYHSYLKESQITEFVNAMKEAVFTAIFSKTNQTDAVKAYQSLCFLCPEICLPYLIDKIYNSIQSLTEPHRFTSILNCLVLVSHELVRYNKSCPTMQTHVIPLLSAVLPGLDNNDTKKCLISFQFLASVLASIPIIDCTSALNLRDDLTEHERELCLQTAKFEDFIHEFFNKIFSLIESVSVDMSDVQMNYKNSNSVDDNIVEIGLTTTLNSLAQQSSHKFLKLMISKISNYINGNMYNQKAGKLVSTLCKSLVKSACGELAFKTFFMPLYETLKRVRESKHYESSLTNERGDIEISWNIQLFQDLMRANGNILLNYVDKIKDIIDWYRKSTHKFTVAYLCAGVRQFLRSLTFFYATESRSTSQCLDFENENLFRQYLPVRDWGKYGDLNNLNINYHIPNEIELKTAIDFVQFYIQQSIDNLNKNSNNMHKDERFRELSFIYNIIVGSARLLRRADSSVNNDHIHTQVDIGTNYNNLSLSDIFDYRKLPKENIREKVALFLLELTDKLLELNTDDSKSLLLICKTYSAISTLYGLFRTEFEKQWKVFQTIKKQFENKLNGKKSHARFLLIDRIILQYEYRIFHINTKLNDLDLKLIDSLFKLSTSSYSEVRKEAQIQLFNLLAHYPFAYLVLTPKIKLLLTNENINHDALKGCLYIIKGNSLQSSFMVKQNWNIISELWPALFQCKYYEKPSIQKLLDSIFETTNKNFDTFSYTTRLRDSTLNKALNFYPVDSANDLSRLEVFEKRIKETNELVQNLARKIIEITNHSQSIWKTQAICFGTLIFLIYPFGKLNSEFVKTFVDSLVHENIVMRKIAIAGMCIIVNVTKFEKPKTEFLTNDVIKDENIVINKACLGERSDNEWHNLDNDKFKIPETDNEWSEIKFIDKTYYGYYCWPSKIKVTQSKRKFFSNNDPDDALMPIYKNFKDENYIQNLFKMLTIEEEKGKEKFDLKIFHLFKGIFRNFGEMLIPNLIERLKTLVRDRKKDTHECSHRLSSEIVSALIRGSKYWPLSKLKQLWFELKEVFDLIIEHMSPETLYFWHNCFSTAMEDQDPRRMFFYINYLKDLVIRKLDEEQSSTFQRSSCLYLLKAINQFEWRIPKIWTEIYNVMLNKMNNPYKVIREKLAHCIAFSLLFDVKLPNHSKMEIKSPKVDHFFEFVSIELDKAIILFKNINDKNPETLSVEHKNAINFVQTFINSFTTFLARSLDPINEHMIKIFSKLCCLDNITATDEQMKMNLNILRSYASIWYAKNNCSSLMIDEIKKVMENENWHAKLSAINIIQSFGIFNLFHLSADIKEQVKDIITKYLIDEQLEVRLACALTLTGFIHSSLIQVDEKLINDFKKLSRTKIKIKDNEGKSILNTQNLVKRHGGLLGLCAIASSSPYEVPSYLPDIITYLCAFINDTAPIQNTIRKCLSEFRRTHHDNWQEHQQYFTEEQLYTINDVLISPNYYA